jgi:MOSC domain-containing protein YiiM
MVPADSLALDPIRGILGDSRYQDRQKPDGSPFKRQVTLIEREVLASHADALGVALFNAGEARSNIETTGIDLVALVGRRLRVGSALLELVEPRDPCWQMDALCQGLKALMDGGRQGVIARIVEPGVVRAGDRVAVEN